MGKSKSTPKKNTVIYGNCKIVDPDGLELCLCLEKRVKWYVDRNLADIISDNPLTARLNFRPKGFNSVKDSYSLSVKENKCVVCGEGNLFNLTKHHIIPYCYRKYMPSLIKENNSHDIVIVCSECHHKYEKTFALELKRKLAKQYDAPLAGNLSNSDSINYASRVAYSLVKYTDKIPEDKKAEKIKHLENLLKIEKISNEEILKLYNDYDVHITTKGYKPHGEKVMSQITNLQEFVEMWRNDFIQKMKPKFMPIGWDLKRPIDFNKKY